MKVENLRGYGLAASDVEGQWDQSVKKRLRKTAQDIVMRNLTFSERLKVGFRFMKEKKRAAALDLSDLYKKGMTNKAFLKQQLEYICLFSAVANVKGKDSAIKIMYSVMDSTADALLLALPEIEDLKSCGEPFEVFRKFFARHPEAAKKAGCHELDVTEYSESAVQMNIHWCVWLELAARMNVPEACIPNCYADDLVYPDYFSALGIKYTRKGTLANGCSMCDFRFEKII